MRGSPLLRTLIVLAALLATGLGLARLTQKGPSRPVTPSIEKAPEPVERKGVPFELILSGTAREISLDGGATAVTGSDTAEPLRGVLELAGEDPLISLQIKWSDTAPGHRFAMLKLEIPGKDTLQHVFTAPGDIDDIWEP